MKDFSVEAGQNGKSIPMGFFYCKCEYKLWVIRRVFRILTCGLDRTVTCEFPFVLIKVTIQSACKLPTFGSFARFKGGRPSLSFISPFSCYPFSSPHFSLFEICIPPSQISSPVPLCVYTPAPYFGQAVGGPVVSIQQLHKESSCQLSGAFSFISLRRQDWQGAACWYKIPAVVLVLLESLII